MLPDPVSDFLEGLMSLYKELPSLWDTNSAEYNDPTKKYIAYMSLRNKMLEMDKHATIDSTKRFLLSVISSMQYTYVNSLQNPSEIANTLWYKNFVLFFMQPHVLHLAADDMYTTLGSDTPNAEIAQTNTAQQLSVDAFPVATAQPNNVLNNPIPNMVLGPQMQPVNSNMMTQCGTGGGVMTQVNNDYQPRFTANIIPSNNVETPHLILINDATTLTRTKLAGKYTQTEGDTHTIFVVPTANSKLNYENNASNEYNLNESSGIMEADNDKNHTDEERIYGVVEKILRDSRDEYSLYGKHVGETIRRMPKDRRKNCQNMIDKILFLAETGDLFNATKIVKSSDLEKNMAQLF